MKRERHAETETNHTKSPAAVERTFTLGSVDSHFHLQDRKWFNSSHLMVFIFPVNEETSREQTKGDLRPRSEERKQEVGREPKATASTLFSKQSCIQLSDKCVCGGASSPEARRCLPQTGDTSSFSGPSPQLLWLQPILTRDSNSKRSDAFFYLSQESESCWGASISQVPNFIYLGLIAENRQLTPTYTFSPIPLPPYPTWSCRNTEAAVLSKPSAVYFFLSVAAPSSPAFEKQRRVTRWIFYRQLPPVPSVSSPLWVRKSPFTLIWEYSSRLLNDLVLNAVILSSRPAWQDSVLRPLICAPLNTKTFWSSTAVLDIQWHRLQVPLAGRSCLPIQMTLLNCLYRVILI